MRWLGLLFLTLCLGSSSLPACGDKEFKEYKKVKVSVVVILASEKGTTIHPQLKHVAAEIRKLHPEFTSFSLHSMKWESVAPNMPLAFETVEEKEVVIVVKHGANRDNKVSLSVAAPTVGKIDYETVCGKFLPIVTRYDTQSKQRLILAIRVQPCKGE